MRRDQPDRLVIAPQARPFGFGRKNLEVAAFPGKNFAESFLALELLRLCVD